MSDKTRRFLSSRTTPMCVSAIRSCSRPTTTTPSLPPIRRPRSARPKHQPDLIILDLGLPAGDGFVVLEWLRANTYLSVIPVIVVSARDLRGNKERALEAGAKAFVQKPWNDSELLALIARVRRTARVRPASQRA